MGLNLIHCKHNDPSGLMSYLLYALLRSVVLRGPSAPRKAIWCLPILLLITLFVNMFFILYKARSALYACMPWQGDQHCMAKCSLHPSSIMCGCVPVPRGSPCLCCPHPLHLQHAGGKEHRQAGYCDSSMGICCCRRRCCTSGCSHWCASAPAADQSVGHNHVSAEMHAF